MAWNPADCTGRSAAIVGEVRGLDNYGPFFAPEANLTGSLVGHQDYWSIKGLCFFNTNMMRMEYRLYTAIGACQVHACFCVPASPPPPPPGQGTARRR